MTACGLSPGGFLTNTFWCLHLNRKNRTFTCYRSASASHTAGILILVFSPAVIGWGNFLCCAVAAH